MVAFRVPWFGSRRGQNFAALYVGAHSSFMGTIWGVAVAWNTTSGSIKRWVRRTKFGCKVPNLKNSHNAHCWCYPLKNCDVRTNKVICMFESQAIRTKSYLGRIANRKLRIFGKLIVQFLSSQPTSQLWFGSYMFKLEILLFKSQFFHIVKPRIL